MVDALESLSMPTIAVLNGLALGGGLEIALACDLRFAAASATLGLTEARIGAIPGGGGSQRLPRLIGTARAMQMMLAGEPVDATTAAAWQIVQDTVVDDMLDAHRRARLCQPGRLAFATNYASAETGRAHRHGAEPRRRAADRARGLGRRVCLGRLCWTRPRALLYRERRAPNFAD